MSVETNLRRLRPSRAKPIPGDIFAMLLPDGKYLFGRVILADLPKGKAPMPTSNLVYIYGVRSSQKDPPPLHLLTPEKLLIAPQFINRMPWSKGYFEVVGHESLAMSDLLRRHCFWDPIRKTYRDEMGGIAEGRTEPCGEWGLQSYRTLDDKISTTLGIPLAPD